MNKTFIVFGMGRSGTSLIAKALHEQGVHMGDEFSQPNHSNPNGYYEDLEFVALNREMIVGDEYSTEAEIDYDACRTLLTVKDIHPLWGWKDPRTVLTLDGYYDEIDDPILVSVFRKPEHIANSLVESDGVDYDKAYKLAVAYQKKTLEELNKRFG